MSKIYPVGIQSFEEIRKNGYCYVDKTALIYQLVSSGKYYFLSRPRRFGKVCFSPHLKPIFQVKKSCLKALPWNKRKKNGQPIPYCIST